MTGIYKITNLINGKVYIGQSVDIEKRWGDHRRDSKTKNNIIYRAIRKYGIENFSFEVIEECSENLLSEREIYYISEYNSYIYAENSNGYNMTLGGESTLGMKLSEETKQKIREKAIGRPSPNIGRITPLEVREKQSQAKLGEKSVWYGKHHSEETKQKMREKATGRKHTEETKQKLREIHLGSKPVNYERVECEGKIFNSIKECAEYYGENYSTVRKWLNGKGYMRQDFIDKGLKYVDKENNQKSSDLKIVNNSRKVICEDITFNSLKECSEYYNLCYGTLKNWLRGRTPMSKEYIDKGLRYETGETKIKEESKKKPNKRLKIRCDNIEFESLSKCSKHYGISIKVMRRWLRDTTTMPQEWINKGLKVIE